MWQENLLLKKPCRTSCPITGVTFQARTGKIRKSLPRPLSNNQKGYGFYYNREAFDGAVYFAVHLKVVP